MLISSFYSVSLSIGRRKSLILRFMCKLIYLSFLQFSVAFLFCKTDGSSLCLQCDAIVHVGGKQTHERYVLLKQRVEVSCPDTSLNGVGGKMPLSKISI